MAWKFHGKRRYYYRCKRVCGRVIHEYVGCGQEGERQAELDRLRRAEREAERQARRAELDRLQAAGTRQWERRHS